MKGSNKLRIFRSFMFWGFLVLTLTLASYGVKFSIADQIADYEEALPGNIHLYFENLTTKETLMASEAMGALNPKFLELQNNITFSHYIQDQCGPIECAGVNQNNGERIYILMDDNPIILKYVLCHELLHTYITSIDHDLEEELVDKISKRFVCYKEPVTNEEGSEVYLE